MMSSAQKKFIVLTSLGGALEFYDFIIFIFLAKILSELFFPAANAIASLMASLAVFAIGYLARPLGGIVFGHYGDKVGRKKTFIRAALFMAFPTFLIGCLPTYQHLGILASILLIMLRLIQGFSVGGEIPGAVVFAVETAMHERRGLMASLILFGVNMGMFLGSLVAALLSHLLSQQQLLQWGWRIPFFIGGGLGVLNFYMRKQLQETQLFQKFQAQQSPIRFPIKEILFRYPLRFLQGFSIASFEAVIVSIIYLFMPTYLATFFHFPTRDLFFLNTINILIYTVPVLLFSHWSDRIGRKKVILISILFFSFFIYPVFTLFAAHHFYWVIFGTWICCFFSSGIAGVFPSMMSELFPIQARYTGVALVYNFAFGIVGGLTPLLATWLIHVSGNRLAPSWILMFFGILNLLILSSVRETYRLPLDDIGR